MPVRCHLPEAACGPGCFREKFSFPSGCRNRVQKGKFSGQGRALGFGESSTESLAAPNL